MRWEESWTKNHNTSQTTLGKMTKGKTAGTYKDEAFVNLIKKKKEASNIHHSTAIKNAESGEGSASGLTLRTTQGIGHLQQWWLGSWSRRSASGWLWTSSRWRWPTAPLTGSLEHKEVSVGGCGPLPNNLTSHTVECESAQIKAFLPNGCRPLWDLTYALWSPWKPSNSSARAAMRMTTTPPLYWREERSRDRGWGKGLASTRSDHICEATLGMVLELGKT